MKIKRSLTAKRHGVGAYWPHILELCEEQLLDLGNLAGKRGTVPRGLSPLEPGAIDHLDHEACERFREKWSRKFREWLRPDAEELLQLRNLVRSALICDPKDRTTLAYRLGTLAPKRLEYDTPEYEDGDYHMVQLLSIVGPGSCTAEARFNLPWALVVPLVNFSEQGHKLVCCRRCGRCMRGRSNQRFCPGGRCRRAWHREQPGNKEKWRAYMKGYMADQRAKDRKERRAAERENEAKKKAKKKQLQKRDKEYRELEARRRKLYQSR